MDFLIHWPPGPVVATVQCQGLWYGHVSKHNSIAMFRVIWQGTVEGVRRGGNKVTG